MFAERRQGGNDPQGWAHNFLGDRQQPLPVLRDSQVAGGLPWQALRARVSAPATVLDAGCGLGAWVDLVHRHGYQGIGVDYAAPMIERLQRERPGPRWIAADIRDVPLPAESVDAIVSWGVIEHDPAGPGAALREFHRLLKPGGWLLATVPSDTPQQRASSRAQFPEGQGEFFQYFFANHELGAEVTAAGFDLDLLQPSSSHYALVHPTLYGRVLKLPAPLRRVANHTLMRYAAHLPAAQSMVLAVGRRRVA